MELHHLMPPWVGSYLASQTIGFPEKRAMDKHSSLLLCCNIRSKKKKFYNIWPKNIAIFKINDCLNQAYSW